MRPILAWMCLVMAKGVITNLMSQNLTRIPTVDRPATVTELMLDKNHIEYIFADDLTSYKELRQLTMREGRLKVIEDGAFDHNDKLQILDFMHNVNALEYLPISFGHPHLADISFWGALNKDIRNFDLRNLTALRRLNIGLCKMGSLDPSKLPQDLDWLVLNLNPLHNLPDLAPHTPNLTRLSASQTQLSYIPDYIMSGLTKLEELQLNNNSLRTIPDLFLLPLSILYLEGNPLECNQSLCWVRMWNYIKPLALSVPGTVVCKYPLALSGTKLMQVHPVDLGCFKGKKHYEIATTLIIVI